MLLTVDTLRADHFAAEIGGEPLTPYLAGFAADAIRFEQASSVGAATSPGIASILTGLRPGRSGVIGNRHTLPKEVPTLATILSSNGFRAAAFVANPVLGRRYGFGRGFAQYSLNRPRDGERKARANDLVDEALTWLAAQPKEARLFLWLHFFEPHGPYQPPESALSHFPVGLFGEPREVPLLEPGKESGWKGVPWYQQLRPRPHRDAREYQRRYAAEVRTLDAGVRRLLAGLDRGRLTETSIIAITADHGEALVDDHGFFFSHENGLTQDQVHVPLVLRIPGRAPSVSDRPVSTVDLFPTLLRALAVKVPALHDGQDLLAGQGGIVVSQSPQEMAVRDGNLKLRQLSSGAVSLHDLDADPGETTDLRSVSAAEVRRLKALLDVERARPPLARAIKRPQPGDDWEEAALRALGYR